MVPVFATFFLTIASASAEVTFFGPTPYRSIADSPIYVSELGSNFFLEDFEDGHFDLPIGVTGYGISILSPGPFTDSVDADDGLIDGSGVNGYSLKPSMVSNTFSNPPQRSAGFALEFDRKLMGTLPNAFGFVWTDGNPGGHLWIRAVDEHGATITSKRFDVDMESSHQGNTAQDVFIGFISDRPIGYVDVVNIYTSEIWLPHFEVDHIQFGVVVPEPVAGIPLLMSIGWLLRSFVAKQRLTCKKAPFHANVVTTSDLPPPQTAPISVS